MQVPVLLTRQVLAKGVPATMGVLSGMVTSVTKAALLVQFGSLVGLGVVGVEVVPGGDCVPAVAVVSVVVGVAACVTGASVGAVVAVGACVFVDVATGISVEACALHPARTIVVSMKAMANLLKIIVASFVH
jgi:hypothetical protein